MPQYADTSSYTAAENALWERLVSCQGREFVTCKGLTFSYVLKGNEMFITRKEKSITRSTINMAYRKARELMEREGFVAGPKKLQTFGASYLYPIFEAVGVIAVPPKDPLDPGGPLLVRDLFATAKPAHLAKALAKRGQAPEARIEELASVSRRLVERLRTVRPEETGRRVVFGVEYLSDDGASRCDVLVYDKTELLSSFRTYPELEMLDDPETVPEGEIPGLLERTGLPERTDWENGWPRVLGYEADQRTVKAAGVSRFLAALIEEVTSPAPLGEEAVPRTLLKNHMAVYRVLADYMSRNGEAEQLRLF